MTEYWTEIDSATKTTLIVTLSIAIVGWIIAIWQFRIVNRNKKSSIIFENRLNIYNEYFEKIDDINERLMIDFDEYLGPTINNIYKTIINEPENSSQALIDLQTALSEITRNTSKTISQTTQELQKLRFIASKKTLEILDDYRDLAQSQVELVPKALETINITQFKNFDSNKNEELKSIGEELILKRNELEKQMRKDLEIE